MPDTTPVEPLPTSAPSVGPDFDPTDQVTQMLMWPSKTKKRGRPVGSTTTVISLPNKRTWARKTPFIKDTAVTKSKFIMQMYIK